MAEPKKENTEETKDADALKGGDEGGAPESTEPKKGAPGADDFDPLAGFDLDEMGLDEDDLAGGDEDDPANDDAPEAEGQSKDAQIAELQAQVTEYAKQNQKLMRQLAEADKVKKRIRTDAAKDADRAVEKFAKKMFDIADTLEAGLKVFSEQERESDPTLDALADGVELTQRSLKKVFNEYGIKEIDAVGKQFDENLHEALQVVDDDKAESGTVVKVMQAGYEKDGKAIRPARVFVAK